VTAQGRQPVYESGGWEVDLARRELRAGGAPVPIGGRAFEIVAVLVQLAGELVTKEIIIGRVWPGAIVEDNTLQVHISAIRKALGADRGMLKTVSGRGYRLLGDWSIRPESTSTTRDVPERNRGAARPFQTNVPVAASALVGREAAVQHLRNLVSAYRVVTLTGPGGIGKTVLASEVARRLIPTIECDVLFVELASLSDPGLVPSAVAGVLGLKLGGDEITPESVARGNGSRKVLLILDSCEHVIDVAARMAEILVRLCPHTTVLATSREVLQIEAEYVFQVSALEVPSLRQGASGDVLGHSAVQLFIARTRALRADFSPDGKNLPTIAAICRRLDGIPLAIEFAAARAAALGPREVAAHLDDRFALLTGGRRTALPRHQTLRATLDWSYELLPETERRLLRHLAVFPAGFTLEAAAAVVSNTESNVALGISSLVSKSLVTSDGSDATRRLRLLETTRAYALEKLAESGEAQQAWRCHAEFFRDLFVSTSPGSRLALGAEGIVPYAREIDSVRAALDWCFSPSGDVVTGLMLTAACAPVWLHMSLLVECRERSERALNNLASDAELTAPLLMQLNISLGIALILTMGPVERTKTVVAKGLSIAESLKDIDAQLRALWARWSIHFTIGECRAAQSTVEQFHRVASQTGDQALILIADRLIGNTLQYGGMPSEAEIRFRRVLGLYEAPKDQRHTILFQYDQRVLARAMLARVLWLQGFIDQANVHARESLEEAIETNNKLTLCWALYYAACPISLMTGDFSNAERTVAMLSDIAVSLNAAFWKIVARCLQGKLLVHRGEYESAADILRPILDARSQTCWASPPPEFLGVFAQALAGFGRHSEARATIENALMRAKDGGENWYVAELLRIKGELLLQGTDNQQATEACFGEALEVAREQGALYWRLRAAIALARLKLTQDRHNEAREVLIAAYGRFTEGFNTADLESARAILDTLPPSPS